MTIPPDPCGRGVDRITLDLFTSEGAPDTTGMAEMAAEATRLEKIRRVLDARFSLGALEDAKRDDPAWWGAARNDMGRGFYGEAMREEARLRAVSDELLDAEVFAINALR